MRKNQRRLRLIKGQGILMTQFIKLDTEIIPFFWSDISPLFNKVINNQGKGRDSLELVRYKLDNNLLKAWVYRNNNIIEAAYCTNIIEYPEKKLDLEYYLEPSKRFLE